MVPGLFRRGEAVVPYVVRVSAGAPFDEVVCGETRGAATTPLFCSFFNRSTVPGFPLFLPLRIGEKPMIARAQKDGYARSSTQNS